MTPPGFALTICIPTYNRAELLGPTLDSITSQAGFADGLVEIVISDNCSDDGTEALGRQLAASYPDRVQYFRHAQAMQADANFEFVLSKGRGNYLKLHNDNLLLREGTLLEMVKVFQATAVEKPIVFFTNGNMSQGQPIEALTSMDDFVRRVSYFSTWIGGFGMWRDEFHAMGDVGRHVALKLVQTDVLFRLLNMGKRAIVLYEVYFIGQAVPRKGGYNIAEVFGQNYLTILKWYRETGKLSEEVFQAEKKLILLRHIIPYYFDQTNHFAKTGFFPFMQDYVGDDYFYQAIAHLPTDVPPALSAPAPAPVPAPEPAPSPEAQRAAYNAALAVQWRALNPHNETILQAAYGLFNFGKLSVGRRTYGGITLWTFGDPGEKLSIGHFCSIADDVKFLLGGNHPHEGVSTFPFLTKYFGQLEATSKGAITVGDDVWIGYNSTILSGVTIGQGAVVAAGSVVTKDVPPYAIVGGNPAKLLKHRFEAAVVEKMLKLDYGRVSDQAILASRDILYQPITLENADAIIAALMR
ncbi:glycosyltransferase [Duganella sp. PWIR1]